eukprot:366394-Chlamydomonas_euryale.AAC.7
MVQALQIRAAQRNRRDLFERVEGRKVDLVLTMEARPGPASLRTDWAPERHTPLPHICPHMFGRARAAPCCSHCPAPSLDAPLSHPIHTCVCRTAGHCTARSGRGSPCAGAHAEEPPAGISAVEGGMRISHWKERHAAASASALLALRARLAQLVALALLARLAQPRCWHTSRQH